jgi:hypothetical protein
VEIPRSQTRTSTATRGLVSGATTHGRLFDIEDDCIIHNGSKRIQWEMRRRSEEGSISSHRTTLIIANWFGMNVVAGVSIFTTNMTAPQPNGDHAAPVTHSAGVKVEGEAGRVSGVSRSSPPFHSPKEMEGPGSAAGMDTRIRGTGMVRRTHG